MVQIIQLACHLGGLGAKTLDDALGTAARLGFRYVDLPSTLVDLKRVVTQSTTEADTIRAALSEFNLTLTDFDLSLPEFNAPDTARREGALTRFEKLLPFVAALKAPGITLSPGPIHDEDLDQSAIYATTGLLRMQRAAAASQLRLSILPQPETVAESPAEWLKLLDDVPGSQLTLDFAYCAYLGLTRKDIKPLLSRSAHVRVRQATKNRLQTGFEAGKLDMNDIIEDLTEVKYTGAISVAYTLTAGEHGALKVDAIDETVKTRDALRNARAALQRQPT
ncbi:MAG: sugar phosphate isomerase/epimerase family protein [Aggregatilineales bacterium]